MKPILILTKNLVLEQELQQRLQYLNYEVFCTVELFERLLVQDYQEAVQKEWLEQFLTLYKTVIISETISDNEIQMILPVLQTKDHILLRKLNSAPSIKEEEQMKKLGINDWIITEHSIDHLREQLSDKLAVYQKEEANIVFFYPRKNTLGDLEKLKNSLSNRELVVLDCLLQAKGEVVSREELCISLWNEAPNNSHLSQSSVLIKKIKMKLELAGYDPETLKTIWGRGYLLVQSALTNEYLMQVR